MKTRNTYENPKPAVASGDLLEHQWRQPPPGTVIIKSGIVQKGDWFYIEQLGAWGLVPEIGWGKPIRNSLIARGTLDETSVDMTRCSNDELRQRGTKNEI